MTMTIHLLQINVWWRQVCHKLWLNMENLYVSFIFTNALCALVRFIVDVGLLLLNVASDPDNVKMSECRLCSF